MIIYAILECVEYANGIKKKVQFGNLAIGAGASVQDVDTTSCELGTELIVGGQKAAAMEFPHMAAVGYPNFNGQLAFKCAGSLISEQFVLTAAHCSIADRVRPTMVRLGDLNLQQREFELPEVDISIDKFISHPAYNKDTKQNDVALIRMTRQATFSRYIRPACLWQKPIIPKSEALATGWGHTEYAGTSSEDLMKVKLDILNIEHCERIYEDGGYQINRNQICAGVLAGGYDTCQGGNKKLRR